MEKHTCSALQSAFIYAIFALVLMSSAVFIGVYAGIDFGRDNAAGDNVAAIQTDASDTGEGESESDTSSKDEEPKATRLIMLDAGHGGEDGGAESASGVLEKDLNLALTDDLAHLCLLFGLPYETTRDDDRLLYDYYSDLTDYTGKKKSLDLKNRLKMTNGASASVFVSIHMNKFTDPVYSGLQVYYSPNNADSETLAGSIQSYVSTHLQKTNDRKTKPAGSSIYLLKHLEIPSVLVECGFLSNYEEAEKLSSKSYRGALAATIFTPLCEYTIRT